MPREGVQISIRITDENVARVVKWREKNIGPSDIFRIGLDALESSYRKEPPSRKTSKEEESNPMDEGLLFGKGLSQRQIQALRLKAEGYDTKGIAKIMGISARAAREHLAEGNRRLAADRSAQRSSFPGKAGRRGRA